MVFGNWTSRRVRAYLDREGLTDLIARAGSALDSTGADASDYALLHSFIRHRKPQYVLECGTGLTTWVIADALKKNVEESQHSASVPIVVSMEDNDAWFDQADRCLPAEFRPYVQLIKSGRVYDHYSIIFGVRYAEIPDYPYELMWVDGPVARYTSSEFSWETEDYEHIAILDLVRLLQRRNLTLTVLIDNLKRTQMAYACLFKQGTIKCYTHWSNVGVLDSVTANDLVLNTGSYIPNFDRIVPKAKPWKAPRFFDQK